jgi:hypothetical protein
MPTATDKSTSNTDSGRRETTHYSDGSSRDVDVNKTTGNVDSITDHDSKGNSHSHEVLHSPWGYSAGAKK